MKVRIDVTQEDIDRAREIVGRSAYAKTRRCCCPLASAIRRAGYARAEVGNTDTWLSKHSGDLDAPRARLPMHAICFRKSFDNGDDVLPFSFELEVPE